MEEKIKEEERGERRGREGTGRNGRGKEKGQEMFISWNAVRSVVMGCY